MPVNGADGAAKISNRALAVQEVRTVLLQPEIQELGMKTCSF